ncbi:SpoIIE family protein phosphatase [Microbispora sp. H10830]|uniref:SpoIIE family protein phosphatase n=1 Tax=Microbispora sp. H10830 TaxID=2729109 RepID=UPI0015FFA142|nr:SpoIIE family protein phosphatase [Microbispora sp. H10830]
MRRHLPSAHGHAGLPDQRLLQAAFDSAGAGIYLTDLAGLITMANLQAGALLRRPVAEMLGADAHDLLHRGADDGLTPRSTCRLMGVLEHGRPARGDESTFLRGDGSLLPVSLSAAPIVQEGGQVLGVIVVFTDITERLNLSRQQAGHLAILEDFNARLTLLTEITSVLTQTLEVDEALQRLGRLIVPRLADWAMVDLRVEHDEVERVVVIPPADQAAGSPLPEPPGSLLARVLDRGETVLLGPGDIARKPDSGMAAAQRELFAARGAVSAIITPLRTQRQVLGALTVARTGPARPFDATDVTLVTDIGRRAGLAVGNARLFGRQREVAEMMQRHLLAPLPQVGHLEMAARYLPASVGSQVGGDWYDAFLLPDGVTALVIGDVVGHDIRAAAEMAQLRSMVRTLAWDRCVSPSLVVNRVDEAMSAVTDVPLATMILARVEGSGDGPWRLRWSNAGHPPPLLVTPDGHARYLEQGQDLLLGLRLGIESTRRDAVEPMPAGSTLVLYTDGLVESPGSDLANGLARLRAQAAAMAHLQLEGVCDEIVRRIPHGTTDDVALLALRLPACGAGA